LITLGVHQIDADSADDEVECVRDQREEDKGFRVFELCLLGQTGAWGQPAYSVRGQDIPYQHQRQLHSYESEQE